jgi:DNA-binding phage protein
MKLSRILADVYETATAMRRSGAMDEKTMREFDALMFPGLDESAWKLMAKQLTLAMEDSNPRVFVTALGTVIRRIGLEPAAQRIGITSARLARVVAPRAKPSFEEVRAVVSGLGFRWGVAQCVIEKAEATRRGRSKHDTQHITPAGRSALLDLTAAEDAVSARTTSRQRGRHDSGAVPSKRVRRQPHLVKVLATMPNVGLDSDFARERARKAARKRR